MPRWRSQAPATDSIDRERLGLLAIVGVLGLVAVAALILLIAGNFGSLIFIILLAAAGALFALRYDRRGPIEVAETDDGGHRILILANEGRGADAIAERLRGSGRDGSELELRIVVPALAGAADRIASDIDSEADDARGCAEELAGQLQDHAAHIEGEVGDPDPRLALEDALRAFPADEVIVTNPPESEMGRLEQRVSDRAGEAPVPVTELHT